MTLPPELPRAVLQSLAIFGAAKPEPSNCGATASDLMSRSKRKVPICGVTTAPSDKAFKAASHRQERAATRSALVRDADAPHPRAFGDPWNGEKDGKLWHGWCAPELLRK
ncbi:hypothetical protein [uncultured Methylobacterium sp.]|uniref:hypothetical protein n=1 Tax=uncultured Methylobacterium sp. TaxID=157278 RepID=UPI0035C9A800